MRVNTENRCQSLTGSKVSAVKTGVERKSDGLFRSMAIKWLSSVRLDENGSPYSHNQSINMNITIGVWILGLELLNSRPVV